MKEFEIFEVTQATPPLWKPQTNLLTVRYGPQNGSCSKSIFICDSCSGIREANVNIISRPLQGFWLRHSIQNGNIHWVFGNIGLVFECLLIDWKGYVYYFGLGLRC